MKYQKFVRLTALILLVLLCLLGARGYAQEESGSIGIEGTIGTAPPTQGATITVPSNGQVFTEIPITVAGLCPDGLLVKVFKNNVFGGSVQCENGSFSITIDLFSGQNDLVARVYDALDQAGPDSNTVTVTFNDSRAGGVNRPTLTSNYAKKGANPGETLVWPIILSGGQGPYAISVDWGDGTTPDLFTREFAGTFDISHIYERSGVYNIIVRASDSNESVAYLQLVGIANGPLGQEAEGDITKNTIIITKILWWPLLFMIPMLFIAFWLGRRHAVQELRRRFEREQRL